MGINGGLILKYVAFCFNSEIFETGGVDCTRSRVRVSSCTNVSKIINTFEDLTVYT